MTPTAFDAIFTEMGFSTKRAWLGGAVAYSVARTYSLLIRELERVYARFGLSAPSFNVLMLLKHGEHPDVLTQQEISSHLVVSASDMSGLIDRLERKGFVQRLPGRDRRSKLLHITSKGSQLLDEIWPLHTETLKRLTVVLSEHEAATLVQALARVRRAAER